MDRGFDNLAYMDALETTKNETIFQSNPGSALYDTFPISKHKTGATSEKYSSEEILVTKKSEAINETEQKSDSRRSSKNSKETIDKEKLSIFDVLTETKKRLRTHGYKQIHPYGQSQLIKLLFETPEDNIFVTVDNDELNILPWLMTVFLMCFIALGIILLAATHAH